MNDFIVNDYLINRLQEIGINHLFGVPGDYSLDFLDRVIKSPIKWVGTCNELNAGYAADGYARVNGIGAAVVTYGVGAFSVLNAVAGAYAELVPMILISGAPHSARRRSGALVHHLTKDYMLQFEIFRKVTVDSTMLTNPETAPEEIDRVLRNCISEKRPVYIELPLDVGLMPCKAPNKFVYNAIPKSDQEILGECIEEAAHKINKAENPILIAGMELLRFGLTKPTLELVEHSELPFATTISSKSALPEMHPQYIGLYQGGMSADWVKNQIESSDCVISLGVWMTDFETGGFTAHLDEKKLINVNSESVKIGHHIYNNVQLGDFIKNIKHLINPRDYLKSHPVKPVKIKENIIPEKDKLLSANFVYTRINNFLDDDKILLVEAGDSISAVEDLQIEEADNFISQAYYLSIGYCTPASLGVALAKPNKRSVVLTGDGAFQMTAQEISTIIRNNCNSIVILINNYGYLIERLLHEDGYYNDIQNWKYAQLPIIFGNNAIGIVAKTEEDLDNAFKLTDKEKDKFIFIEVQILNNDCCNGLKKLTANLKKLAESKG